MYDEALVNSWFRIDPKDYDRFDMGETVLQTADMTAEEIVEFCNGIYKIFLSPRYIVKHLARIRSWKDLDFTAKGFVKVLGHVRDFAKASK